MNNRVLVTYGTKAGSTAEVAARIGEILSEQDLAVDVMPVSRVSDVTPYRAVIVGSAIRAGRLLPNVMSFLEKHQAALQQKPFSVFVVCMTMATEDEASRKTVSAYLEPVRALVRPAREGLFAGVMNLSKLNWLERLMMKVMKAPEGDFRNWEQISAWAKTVPIGA